MYCHFRFRIRLFPSRSYSDEIKFLLVFLLKALSETYNYKQLIRCSVTFALPCYHSYNNIST